MILSKGKAKSSFMKLKMVVALGGIACCVVLGACWQKQQEASSAEAESEATDTLTRENAEEAADTLLLDKETAETPMPATVDEFFGDFIYNFDQSNRLQRSRIVFPLPITETNGEQRLIERRDWKHHYLFLQQEFCTVLWNSHKQMDLAQDTSLTHARVEQIYLHSRKIQAFLFERDSLSRQWMLVGEQIIPFEHTELSSFLDFYRQFSTDSIFQRQHVVEPLQFTMVDEENEYELVNGVINRDQWFEFQPDMPRDVLININYGQTYNRRSRIYMQMRGINNGLQTLFTFQRKGEQWQLKAFEN